MENRLQGVVVKFDAILCNPPYQGTHNSPTEMWSQVHGRAMSVLRSGGMAAFVHPAAWRGVSDAHRAMRRCRKAMRTWDIPWIQMLPIRDPAFGIGLPVDLYTLRKAETPGLLTEVEGIGGDSASIDLRAARFLSNARFGEIDPLLGQWGDEFVTILDDRHYEMFSPPKPWMSETRTDEHVHPCVYTISLRTGEPTLHWSRRRDLGHFGIPKVIWTDRDTPGIPLLDLEGRYGLSTNAAAIVDDREILPEIAEAMRSERFRDLMETARVGRRGWNLPLMKQFRRDFWREFR